MPPISKLGPDALLEPMKLDVFIESLGKKKLAIKTLLLDQVKISTEEQQDCTVLYLFSVCSSWCWIKELTLYKLQLAVSQSIINFNASKD